MVALHLWTHVTCRLTAANRHQLQNPTLGNRVRATFTFTIFLVLVYDAELRLANVTATKATPLTCTHEQHSPRQAENGDCSTPILSLRFTSYHRTLSRAHAYFLQFDSIDTPRATRSPVRSISLRCKSAGSSSNWHQQPRMAS